MKQLMFEVFPTFHKRAAASLFLCQTLTRGRRLLWEWTGTVHFVHAVQGALEAQRLRVVDSTDNPWQRWRRATEALVHPGPITHAHVHLALHLPGQVALGPVVQALHAARTTCVSMLGEESEAEQ